MRPLRLRIQGLRSYRLLQEIDFRDKKLVAIVGNTGAGKSSLLEAMVYALYNATTWNKQSVAALISDGEKSMAVVFDFEVAGVAWRVERATCRDNYPPAQHKLVCLADPARPALTQESTVNQEIERILGLNYEAFKSAILLPQGQFQALVTAKGAVRTGILKAILRLDVQVDTLLAAAAAASTRIVPQLDARLAERARLHPDPAATGLDAGQRKDAAIKRYKDLKALLEQYLAAAAKADRAKMESSSLSQDRTRLADALSGDATVLAGLTAILTDIDERRTVQRQEEREAAGQAEAVFIMLRDAEECGEGLAHLSAADVALRNLLAAMPELDQENRRLELEARELAEETRVIEDAAAKRPALESALQASETKLKEATEAVNTALARHTEARTALASARATQVEKDKAEVALEKVRASLRGHEEEREAAGIRHVAMTAALEAAEREHRSALRTHAAAHAASGLAGGDACPICARPLEDGFEPPEDRSAAAEKGLNDAQLDANKAREAVASAEERCAGSRRTLKEKEDEAIARQRAATEALTFLARLTGPVDLGTDDAAILRPLVESGRELRVVEAGAKKERDAAKGDLAVLDAELTPRRKALADRRRRETADRQKLADRSHTVEADRVALPMTYRPDKGAGTPQITGTHARLQGRLVELRELNAKQEAITKRRDVAQKALRDLDREHAVKVTAPEQVSWPRLVVLADRLAEVGSGVDLSGVPSGDAPLVERVTWSQRMESLALTAVAELEQRSATAAMEAKASRELSETLLAGSGFPSAAGLERACAGADGEAQAAAAEEEKALKQVPLADDLDRRIGPARELRDALTALTGLLSDGKFVGFVVERRQRTLLAVASTIFRSMTRERYAFAENFRIVDLTTSQARAVETLSGGETFLASLALALALVELAGRGGGVVDSLILDEGFASLDTSVLTDALDELARRASTGKLVALVSHLGAVADIAPDVLYVLQKDGTSVARWGMDGQDDPELDAVDARLHRA